MPVSRGSMGTTGVARNRRAPQGEVSIDERLEKLVERHETLTLTVELMVAENRKRDRRMTDILEACSSPGGTLRRSTSVVSSAWKRSSDPPLQRALYSGMCSGGLMICQPSPLRAFRKTTSSFFS